MDNPKNKPHPAFRRLNLIKDEQMVKSAITGADYHRHNIDKLLKIPHKEWKSVHSNILHWEVRGFYWELVAAFDLVLQWSNDTFDLGMREDQVNWGRIDNADNAGKNEDLWVEVKQYLRDTRESEWYFEVNKYRNFSHRSFFEITSFTDTEGNNPPQCFIKQSRHGQNLEPLDEALPRYVQEFNNFVEGISKIIRDYNQARE